MARGVHGVRAEQLARGVEDEAGEVRVVHRDRIAANHLDARPRRRARPRRPRRPGARPRARARAWPPRRVRIVPSRLAVSGITLRVVPASIFATVSTAGSKTWTRRVTSVWNAWTISHAIGIGSRQSCGAEAWPPLPRTDDLDACRRTPSRRPGRAEMTPAVSRCVTCSAKARRRRRAAVEQALLDHDPRAVVALLAGLEHEQHRAGERVATAGEQARRADQHRRVRVVAARVHRALHLRGERKPGLLRHRQGVHVRAQQDRRPRPRPGEARDHRRRALSGPHLEAEPREGLEDGRLRARHREADLGLAVNAAAELDGVVEDGAGVAEDLRSVHGSELYGPSRTVYAAAVGVRPERANKSCTGSNKSCARSIERRKR